MDKPPILEIEDVTSPAISPSMQIWEEPVVERVLTPPALPRRAKPHSSKVADAPPATLIETGKLLLRDSRFHVPLILIVSITLAVGFLFGYGTHRLFNIAARSTSSNTDAEISESDSQKGITWTGCVQYLDATHIPLSDAGTLVLLLPIDKSPTLKFSDAGLHPRATRNEDITKDIEEFGGFCLTVDTKGFFRVSLESSAKFLLLVVSAQSDRPDGDVIDSATLGKLKKYFTMPEKLIQNSQYICEEIRIDSLATPFFYVFAHRAVPK